MYYPGSEKVEACARTFGELAGIYYHMPCQKNTFNKEDIEEIFREVTKNVCGGCGRFEECWKRQALRTYQKIYELLEQQENFSTEEQMERIKSVCVFPELLVQTMQECFRRERMKLYYTNRLLESREVVADQLWEMSRILEDMLDDVFRTAEMKTPYNQRICRLFSKKGVEVYRIFQMQKKKHACEIYITMAAKKGRFVPVKDLAGILSVILRKKIIPAREMRAMVGYEEETILFVEEPKYHVGYGVARKPKEGERVSGDNFSYLQNDRGEVVLGLSDGMGSGIAASAESTRLLELLEQFLESGVRQETALKLINSTAVYERFSYSTLDVCTLDLHSGVCEIHKLGAAATFLYIDGGVEIVQSIRIPTGLFHHLEIMGIQHRLGDGDYIIMVTDGVLEALPGPDKEEWFADLIRGQMVRNPQELAARLMDCVMEVCAEGPEDDMTIYVAGIWQKA